MGYRLSKIITKTGDAGQTGLADGTRCHKHDLRIIVMGEVDELNCHLGLLLTQAHATTFAEILYWLQHQLFELGAELALPSQVRINNDVITTIEKHAQYYNQQLSPLTEFILPGGHPLVAQLHLARAVTRRVERQYVELHQRDAQNPHSLILLNRLSDLLFIMARYACVLTQTSEIYWNHQLNTPTVPSA